MSTKERLSRRTVLFMRSLSPSSGAFTIGKRDSLMKRFVVLVFVFGGFAVEFRAVESRVAVAQPAPAAHKGPRAPATLDPTLTPYADPYGPRKPSASPPPLDPTLTPYADPYADPYAPQGTGASPALVGPVQPVSQSPSRPAPVEPAQPASPPPLIGPVQPPSMAPPSPPPPSLSS